MSIRLVLAVLMGAIPFVSTVSARTWVKSEKASQSKVVAKDVDIEVRSGKGMIIVSTAKSVQVKVYSILGKLISQDTIPAGTSYFSVNSHGVFIVKIGDLTCKVAL